MVPGLSDRWISSRTFELSPQERCGFVDKSNNPNYTQKMQCDTATFKFIKMFMIISASPIEIFMADVTLDCVSAKLVAKFA